MRALIASMLCCAFSLPAAADYRQIGPGLPLRQAQAYCELAALQYQQGYYAYGSTAYVAGATLGNAIGNAIRQHQVFNNCMILQGWEHFRPKVTFQSGGKVKAKAGSALGGKSSNR
jgi:hypothetical protein